MVEIEEDIDKLEFEYDESLFEIKEKILEDKTKTVLKKGDIIKITCLKDLDSDKEIRVYAYPKITAENTANSGGASLPISNDLRSVINRKLAGRIIVLQNDSNVRKEEKIVLVPVKTNVSGLKDSTGNFVASDITNLCYYMYQSLIIPIIEMSLNILDLSSNNDFKLITDEKTGGQTYGKYIYDFNE